LSLLVTNGKANKSLLIETWDKIIAEWEKETGKNLISTAYVKTINDISKQNRILGLVTAYYLLAYGAKEGIDFAKSHGVAVKAANHEAANMVRNKLLQIDSQFKIQVLIKKEKDKRTESIHEPTFYELMVMAKEALGIEISNDINCLEWIAINRQIEKKNKYGKDTKGGRVNSAR
jgi:hypothetical protein